VALGRQRRDQLVLRADVARDDLRRAGAPAVDHEVDGRQVEELLLLPLGGRGQRHGDAAVRDQRQQERDRPLGEIAVEGDDRTASDPAFIQDIPPGSHPADQLIVTDRPPVADDGLAISPLADAVEQPRLSQLTPPR
jgi:hypothetical protein